MIKDLLNITAESLKDDQTMAFEAVENLMGGCGIKSGSGQCGSN